MVCWVYGGEAWWFARFEAVFNCFWYELWVIFLGSKGQVARWRERERGREIN